MESTHAVSVSLRTHTERSVVDQQHLIAAGQRRTWVRRIVGGGQIVETCPDWCTATHASDQVGNLDDLTHRGPETGMRIEMHLMGDSGPAAWPILNVTIAADPYSEEPARRTPHAIIEPSVDDVIENVTPDELAAFIRDVRAHCDRLERVHARLVEAVAGHRTAVSS